ncbi:nudix family hydrolase-like protein [Amylocarpus encephaloides]|uniref:Nudix family hydrolase-like protein n=1 Tax=Amylocarpus encephaloides TaxID=45428 RepID=A0A9P7YI35_9HELO|nr:nudix family hydrolase-like protein [Amylocarpus encephaloides]
MTSPGITDDPELLNHLQRVLESLSHNPYPHVPNPEKCNKRASVALVLRVRPNYHHWPSVPRLDKSPPTTIAQFFEQDWVRHGDPEAVFIKRAARKGDRWTSHVALPGGKRDPEDEDDKAVAVRETVEEIGLDLNSENALYIGNLPERVVRSSMGIVPLMVLCPHVFLWTQPDLPPLLLQPTEVASTHWVPLRVMLSPSSWTYEYVDASDRFANQGGVFVRSILRSILGKMEFSAIRLLPSESLYSSSTSEFFSPGTSTTQASGRSIFSRWWNGGEVHPADKTNPLLLWGLTLGVFADFLAQLPPHNAVQLWSYPTFTSPDVRMAINLLTHSLKRRNEANLQSPGVSQIAVDSETQAIATEDSINNQVTPAAKGKNDSRPYAVGVMLEGYYDLVRQGVWIAASVRAITTAVLIFKLVRRFRWSGA